MQQALDKIIKRIAIDLTEAFDRNFEKQSFFGQKWQRRKSPVRGQRSGHLLIDTGQLRRSIQHRTTGNTVSFTSNLPYAAIHNEGGDIVITPRMHRFFWAKYREENGGTWKRKTPAADFWKALALKPVGEKIHIPQRQFLGYSRKVEHIVNTIIEKYLPPAINRQLKKATEK